MKILPSFTDDIRFTMDVKIEADLINGLKQGMVIIERWLRLNKMLVNQMKTIFMPYGRSANYYPGNEEIVRKWTYKTDKYCKISWCQGR